MYWIKKKISLNIDKALLEKIDKEAKKRYTRYYWRLQRSKMIEYMLRWYLSKNKE